MQPGQLSTGQRTVLQEIGIDVWVRRRDDVVERPEADAECAPMAGSTGQADDWSTLNSEIRACTACDLCESRTQAVCGIGNENADWLVIGEAPGADEDQQGEPFVGRAGQLLNEMLRAAGRQREQVYIANILKCRPPNNRDPQPSEVDSCMPFLQRQISMLKPALILVVGRIAAQNLFQTDTPIGKLRGRVHSYRYGETDIPVVVTYHPAYLLRSPRQKSKSWEDLQLAMSVPVKVRA
jgi:DNA polymerase